MLFINLDKQIRCYTDNFLSDYEDSKSKWISESDGFIRDIIIQVSSRIGAIKFNSTDRTGEWISGIRILYKTAFAGGVESPMSKNESC